ncbi:MAG: hypothetical protein HYY95_01580, partial [Candidatus Rokubacteria bacterium]|nr:hypothetical protein [Candidatus Rokubacteria bacterium]
MGAAGSRPALGHGGFDREAGDLLALHTHPVVRAARLSQHHIEENDSTQKSRTQIICTGRELDAAEMERLGLVLAVHPAERLLPEAHALGARIGASGPLAVRGA